MTVGGGAATVTTESRSVSEPFVHVIVYGFVLPTAGSTTSLVLPFTLPPGTVKSPLVQLVAFSESHFNSTSSETPIRRGLPAVGLSHRVVPILRTCKSTLGLTEVTTTGTEQLKGPLENVPENV